MMKKGILLVLFLSWACTANAQGKIQDGLLKIYKNNVIGNLANCQKLKLDGVAFEYYKNGDIKRQSWYSQNHLQGPTEFFSEKKALVQVNVYDQDKIVEVKKFTD